MLMIDIWRRKRSLHHLFTFDCLMNTSSQYMHKMMAIEGIWFQTVVIIIICWITNVTVNMDDITRFFSKGFFFGWWHSACRIIFSFFFLCAETFVQTNNTKKKDEKTGIAFSESNNKTHYSWWPVLLTNM
jgi:hypothetical protein